MPLPTCSVRARPEHHHLLRRLARALASRPELAPSFEALIVDVTQAVTQVNTPTDQRLDDLERRVDRLEAEAVLRNETQDVLPERVTRNTAQQHTPADVTREPRPAAPGKRRSPTSITDDLRRQVHDLRAKNRSRDSIAAELEIGGATVSKILNAPRPVD
jgi:hypothetical protein